MTWHIIGITWIRPLWLLAIPLLLIAIFLIARQPRKLSYWQKKLPKHLHSALLTQPKPQRESIKWILMSFALTLTCLALAGPYKVSLNNQAKEYPAVILFPLTDSMLASDWSPNRLQYLREFLLSQLDNTPTSLGWVVYAGSAHVLLPPNQDQQTLAHLLRSIEPSTMPKAGQRADLALKEAQTLLQLTPNNPIILLTDQLSPQESQKIVHQLKQHPHPLYIVPIGTAKGSPYLKQGQLVRDQDGIIKLAQLNLDALNQLAYTTNSSMIRLEQLPALLQQLPKQQEAANQHTQPTLLAGFLLLVILLLIALGARQGWLLMLVIFISPQPSYAMPWDDLWWRKDQQAMHVLSTQPAVAAALFTDTRWQAVAYFRAGQFLSAAELFAQGDEAIDAYNQGLALFMAGELTQAQQAFEEALKRQSDFPEAAHNLQVTKSALEQLNAKQEKTSHTVKDEIGQEIPTNPIYIHIDSEHQLTNVLPVNTPNNELSLLTLDAWLEQIPDNPGLLLKNKFWLELQSKGAK